MRYLVVTPLVTLLWQPHWVAVVAISSITLEVNIRTITDRMRQYSCSLHLILLNKTKQLLTRLGKR